MAIEKTQEDIVNSFLAGLDNNQITTEEVSFYEVEKIFKLPPVFEEKRKETFSVAFLKAKGQAIGFRDLAQAFLWVLKNKPGVCSIAWSRTRPEMMETTWVPGFSQEVNLSDEDILAVVENVFKSRGKMESFTWTFGSSTVQLTYQLPGTF